jgi:hypothetical protein
MSDTPLPDDRIAPFDQESARLVERVRLMGVMLSELLDQGFERGEALSIVFAEFYPTYVDEE